MAGYKFSDADCNGPRSELTKHDMEVRRLFAARMLREGRSPEFEAAIRDVIRETGWNRNHATWEAMRRLGYKSATVERTKRREFLAFQNRTKAEIKLMQLKSEEAAANRQREVQEAFETALAGIESPTAQPQNEWDWISAHPAMLRKDRALEKDARVTLTAEDVKSAPSKRAVIQLQHWVNDPRKFQEALIAIQKKQQEGSSGGQMEGEDDMDELNQLLAEVSGRPV